MDKWNLFSLFLISISLSEIANKANVNLNVNAMGVFQHSDNPLLTLIVSLCYCVAFLSLISMFNLAEKDVVKITTKTPKK